MLLSLNRTQNPSAVPIAVNREELTCEETSCGFEDALGLPGIRTSQCWIDVKFTIVGVYVTCTTKEDCAGITPSRTFSENAGSSDGPCDDVSCEDDPLVD